MLDLNIIFPEQQNLYNEKLINFEKNFSYPLGGDRFYISHGQDYFKFFNDLGTATHLIAAENDKIVAIAALVLRDNVVNNDKIYYICDLKILPQYRGKNIIQKFINFAFESNIIKSSCFYSISMDDPAFKENRLARLSSRITNFKLQIGGKIFIYIIDCKILSKITMDLYAYFGPFSFKNMSGVKDLILQSSGEPLHILHLIKNDNPCLVQEMYDTKDIKYMFCLPGNSSFINKLSSMGIEHFASASILQHNMQYDVWDFINTSEL